MADCAFTLTREEQIAYIKIESRRGKGAPEIPNALEAFQRQYLRIVQSGGGYVNLIMEEAM